MAVKPDPDPGVNSWLEDELYQQYLHDRGAVDESWKHVFEEAGNGHPAAPQPSEPGPQQAVPVTVSGEELAPLRGAAARIAKNMECSVAIPVATSHSAIPG